MTKKYFTKLLNQELESVELVVLLRDKTFNKQQDVASTSTSASTNKQFTLFTGQVGMVDSYKDTIRKYVVAFEDFETNDEYAVKLIERKHLLPLECFNFKQLYAQPGVPLLKKVSTTISNFIPLLKNRSQRESDSPTSSSVVTSLFSSQDDHLLSLSFPLEEDYVHEEELDNVDEEYYKFLEEIVKTKTEKEFDQKYNGFFENHKDDYKRYLEFKFNEGDLVTIKSDLVAENNTKLKLYAGQVGMIINPEDPSKLRANHVQVVFRPLSINNFLKYKDELIKGKSELAFLPWIPERYNFEVRGQIHKGLILPIYTDILP